MCIQHARVTRSSLQPRPPTNCPFSASGPDRQHAPPVVSTSFSYRACPTVSVAVSWAAHRQPASVHPRRVLPRRRPGSASAAMPAYIIRLQRQHHLQLGIRPNTMVTTPTTSAPSATPSTSCRVRRPRFECCLQIRLPDGILALQILECTSEASCAVDQQFARRVHARIHLGSFCAPQTAESGSTV